MKKMRYDDESILAVLSRLDLEDCYELTENSVDLSQKNISDEDLAALSYASKCDATVTKFVINNSQLDNHKAQELALNLKDNPNIAILQLKNNQIPDEGVLDLVRLLENNENIKELHLQGNNVSLDTIKNICSIIKNNETILVFNVTTSEETNSEHAPYNRFIAKRLELNSNIAKLMDQLDRYPNIDQHNPDDISNLFDNNHVIKQLTVDKLELTGELNALSGELYI